jgi:predicted PurR-regulated permease PerM
MPEKSKRSLLVDSIPLMDKRKAMKFIVYGLIAAILFGLIMMISRSISDNAGSWAAIANQDNYMNYWSGLYGYNDYIQNQENIDRIQYWMGFQDVIFMNIARVGINIALVFILIGFLSFAVTENMDERTRRIYLIISGMILLLIMFTTLFSSVVVTVS